MQFVGAADPAHFRIVANGLVDGEMRSPLGDAEDSRYANFLQTMKDMLDDGASYFCFLRRIVGLFQETRATLADAAFVQNALASGTA